MQGCGLTGSRGRGSSVLPDWRSCLRGRCAVLPPATEKLLTNWSISLSWAGRIEGECLTAVKSKTVVCGGGVCCCECLFSVWVRAGPTHRVSSQPFSVESCSCVTHLMNISGTTSQARLLQIKFNMFVRLSALRRQVETPCFELSKFHPFPTPTRKKTLPTPSEL